MKNPVPGILSLLSCAFVTASCTLHEYPDSESTVPTQTILTANILLSPGMPESNHRLPDNASEKFLHRFIVEAVTTDGHAAARSVVYAPVEKYSTVSRSVSMQLNARKYRILAWSDYVLQNSFAPIYYNASSLQPVKAIAGAPLPSDLKDCFFAVGEADLLQAYTDPNTPKTVELYLTRPVGRYEIITTDIGALRRDIAQGLIKDGALTATIVYPDYTPTGFNVLNDVPKELVIQSSYKIAIDYANDKTQMRIGMDYLFAATESSRIPVRIIIGTDDNKIVRTSNIVIPIHRNTNTVISGRFLSITTENGVAIDNNYDGVINIDLGKI